MQYPFVAALMFVTGGHPHISGRKPPLLPITHFAQPYIAIGGVSQPARQPSLLPSPQHIPAPNHSPPPLPTDSSIATPFSTHPTPPPPRETEHSQHSSHHDYDHPRHVCVPTPRAYCCPVATWHRFVYSLPQARLVRAPASSSERSAAARRESLTISCMVFCCAVRQRSRLRRMGFSCSLSLGGRSEQVWLDQTTCLGPVFLRGQERGV
ncbi:unnamed protein product [Diplocarpon coronariae]